MAEMTPADIPQEFVDAAVAAVRAAYQAAPRNLNNEEGMRIMLAAVLPLNRRQVRAGIVAELEAHVADCEAHGLPEEARYMAAAARYIRSDPEDNDQEPTDG